MTRVSEIRGKTAMSAFRAICRRVGETNSRVRRLAERDPLNRAIGALAKLKGGAFGVGYEEAADLAIRYAEAVDPESSATPAIAAGCWDDYKPAVWPPVGSWSARLMGDAIQVVYSPADLSPYVGKAMVDALPVGGPL